MGVVSNGTSWKSALLPVGSTCTVTEDQVNANVPGYDLAVEEKTVTVTNADLNPTATLENTYTERVGSIQLVKEAVGFATDAERDEKTFPVTVSCLLEEEPRTVNLKHNKPEVIANIREGDICTISEDKAAAEVDGYTLASPVIDQPKVTVVNGQTHRVNVTNTYTQKPASLIITKKLVDPKGAIQAGTTFPITYNCGEGENMSGTVNLAADGQHRVENIPAGRTCTVTETPAEVNGFTPSVNIEGSPTVVAAGATANVVVTNTYTEKPGALKITKTLTAPEGAPFAQEKFTINYSCDVDGFRDKTVSLGNGQSETITGIPAGTVCTVSENVPTAPGYTGVVTIDNDEVTIQRGVEAAVEVTNTYTRDLGSLVITKKVEAEDNAPFAGRAFDITYTCGDAQNPVKSGTVSLANGGSETIGDIPTGTECAIAEDAVKAGQKGYAHVVTIDQPTVVITKDEPVTATVTNRYTPLAGSFMISKSVLGDGAAKAKDKVFTFTYECMDLYGTSQGKKSVEIAEGTSKSLETRPGTCVISEEAALIEHTQHELAFVVDGQDQGKGPVTITVPENGEPIDVKALNTYTLDRGIFTVKKTVEGLPNAADKQFTFEYSCTGDVTGKVNVAGDGVAVQAGNAIPVGTECTFTENVASAQVEGFNVVVPEAQKGMITAGDEVVELSFVNSYTEKPAPQPEQPKPNPPTQDQPKPDGSGKSKVDSPKTQASGKQADGKLASTGSTAMTVVAVAAATLILGAAVTWMVRRRK